MRYRPTREFTYRSRESPFGAAEGGTEHRERCAAPVLADSCADIVARGSCTAE